MAGVGEWYRADMRLVYPEAFARPSSNTPSVKFTEEQTP
jgi:hypothetical protein